MAGFLGAMFGRAALGAGIGGFAGAVGAERDPHGENFNAIRGAADGAAKGAMAGIFLGGTMRLSSAYNKGFVKGASNTAGGIVDAVKGGLSQPKGVAGAGAGFAEKLTGGGLKGAWDTVMEGAGYMAGAAPSAMAAPFVGGFRGANALQSHRRGGVEVSNRDTFKSMARIGAKGGAFATLGVGAFMPTAGVPGVGKNQRADMASARNQQQMAMADAVIMRNPKMAGMRDVDGAYDYMPANRSSAMPLNGRQAQQHQQMMRRSQRRRRTIEPGMYGDGGNLVFAMNDLRKSY